MRRRARLVLLSGVLGLGIAGWGLAGFMASAHAAPPAGDEVPVTVTTRVTPESSNIGDRLDLRVIAAYPQGYSVNLPTGFDFGDFHVVEATDSEPESSGQGFRKTFHIAFQVFDTGELETPAFDLTYVDPSGQVQTLAVPPHAFKVESLLANEVDPQRRGEDPPISLEYPNPSAEAQIYGSLIGLLVAALAWWAFTRWRRREREQVLPPPIPAHVTAYEALEGLEARRDEMLEGGAYGEYYLRLTEILKGYLQGRFGVDALDRTTEEIRRDLELARRGRDLGGLEARELVRFLQDCDLVKFARYAPPIEDATKDLVQVRQFVDRSVPRDGDDAKARGEEGAEPERPETSKGEAA